MRAIGHVGRGRGLDYLALAEEEEARLCDGHRSDEGLCSFEELSEADHGGTWIDWGITWDAQKIFCDVPGVPANLADDVFGRETNGFPNSSPDDGTQRQNTIMDGE